MAPADNKDLDDGAGKAASGGSNGQGLLNRPISELTNEEFAAVKIEIRRSLELQEACGGAEAAAANEKFQRIIAEIEDLKENEFELRLKEIAKRHGVSAGLLRKWWRQLHQSLNETRPGGGKKVELPLEDPWPQPVGTAEILCTILEKLREHVVLDSGGVLAVALYTMLTYTVSDLQLCPMLLLKSAVKRSGKTTLLGLLLRMSFRALSVSSISSAALYRVVDSLQPTLLLDEVDATLTQKTDTAEALRGLLNAGNDRTSSRVLRCVGEDREVVSFEAFGAKVLAGIGHIPDTMEDRSIVVELRRKLENEKIRRFSVLDDQGEFKEIRRKLLRWAGDHGRAVGKARPLIPSGLNDRASDNWAALLAIADMAGGEWPLRARASALELSGAGRDEEQDVRFELLKDIRAVFGAEGTDCKAIATSVLIDRLCELEESPWSTFYRGERINPRGLGRMLKAFGIVSANLKIGRDGETGKDTVAKGYKRESFSDAWMRYLPPLKGPNGEEVADNCRYRYPTATDGKVQNIGFLQRIRKDEGSGSGVADKMGGGP